MPPCTECDTVMRKRSRALRRGPDPAAGSAQPVMITSSTQQDAAHACLREPPEPIRPLRISGGIPRPHRPRAADDANLTRGARRGEYGVHPTRCAPKASMTESSPRGAGGRGRLTPRSTPLGAVPSGRRPGLGACADAELLVEIGAALRAAVEARERELLVRRVHLVVVEAETHEDAGQVVRLLERGHDRDRAAL